MPAIGVDNTESTDFNIYASVYLESIRGYSEQNPTHTITDVHFVDTNTSILLAIRGACEELETESSFLSQRETSSRLTRWGGTLSDISKGTLPPLFSSNCRQVSKSAPQALTKPHNDETRQGRSKSTGLQSDRKRLSRNQTGQEASLFVLAGSRPLFLRHQQANRIPPYQPLDQGCSKTAIFQTGQESQHLVWPRYIPSLQDSFVNKPLPPVNRREMRTSLTEKPHHGTFGLTHLQTDQRSTRRNTFTQVPFPSLPSNNKPSIERATRHRKTGQERVFHVESGKVPPIKLSSDSIPLSAPPRQDSFETPSFQRSENEIRTPPHHQSRLETTVYQTSHERTPRDGSDHDQSVLVPSASRPLSVRLQQAITIPHYQTHRLFNPEPRIPIQETGISETDEFPCYKMDARPRGMCLIINNRIFSSGLNDAEGMNLSTRHGTERDTESLEAIFTKLDFMVTTKENLTDHEMNRELADIAINRDHTQYDCFVCCILSHGAEGQVYGSNNKSVEIRQLTSMVQPNMCPSLGGKPKLFFIQACQGCHKQEGTDVAVDESWTEEDAVNDVRSRQLIPDEADFLLGYSTVPGYVSFRHTINGTWYIDKLVEILEKYHERMSLLKILTKVNDEVSKLEVVIDGIPFKQMPVIKSTLRRRLLFK